MALADYFNGKNTATVLPSGEGLLKSQQGMDNMLLAVEQMKAEAYKRNSEEFQKASNIPPEFLLTDSAQKAQMGAINLFNQKWGKVYQQTGGNLSDAQKMQMNTDKNVVLMTQQKLQSDMTQAMAAKDAIQKDVQGNLDHSSFQKRWDDYTSTGNWDSSPLLPSAQDPDEFFNKASNKVNGTPSNVTVTKSIGGVPYKETYQASGSEQEGRDMVKTTLLSNDRLARSYIEKFQQLKDTDPETYKKYLDTNKDGKVSPSEENAAKTASNPILQWAQDNYWHKALDMKLTNPSKVSTGTGSQPSGADWSTIYDVNGKKIPYKPNKGDVSTVAGSQNFHPFSDMKLAERPISVKTNANIKVLTNGMMSKVPSKSTVLFQATPTGYDQQHDRLIFNLDKDFNNIGITGVTQGKGTQVSIPRQDITDPTFYNNIEVLDDSGKKTKIGDLVGTSTTKPKVNIGL